MKRTIRNDKNSDVMDFTVLGTRNLTDLVTRLFDASDSDWILDDDDKIILLFNTGWKDGYNASTDDLGGFSINMIHKLIYKTDVFADFYGKDGHAGIKLNKDALKRRMGIDWSSGRSVLDDMNARNGFRDYDPRNDDFDSWADSMKKNLLF